MAQLILTPQQHFQVLMIITGYDLEVAKDATVLGNNEGHHCLTLDHDTYVKLMAYWIQYPTTMDDLNDETDPEDDWTEGVNRASEGFPFLELSNEEYADVMKWVQPSIKVPKAENNVISLPMMDRNFEEIIEFIIPVVERYFDGTNEDDESPSIH